MRSGFRGFNIVFLSIDQEFTVGPCHKLLSGPLSVIIEFETITLQSCFIIK